ncbi:integrase [Methylobacterium variabile]|jgi:transposase InsO family protein|uniref:Integrase n=1 Tax=Methylobacterium variabile TaxID=298794 RepID=A0A0J6S7I0_9HYPH|nr:IS481 family transposase [Methylobacterium variabile]KMO31180.1 integrase [Methylobacterium variabile]
MGQVLHGSATTTETVRRAIQARQEGVRAAAKRYGVSPTTVQKWRSRQTSSDARMGPKEPRSSVLSLEDEAVIVAFRRHTLLPLDDCLYALQPTLPHLTRSSLHRCLQRHGISRLPDVDGDKPKRSRFKADPIGYFHIDIAQVSTEQGKLHLFVAIDRTSKFVFVQLHEKATQRIAAAFLHDLVAAVSYTIHTVRTDNGIQFTDNRPVDEEAEAQAAAYWATQNRPRIYRWHSFAWACEQTRIEHRLTKPRCQWTNGQVERMNRTIKGATVKRYHYASHDELRQHLQLFVDAYNYGRRLKTLRGLTPYEFIYQNWTKEPERFRLDPSHHMPGPNI